MFGDCHKEITLEDRINNGHLSSYAFQQVDDDMKLDNSSIIHGNSQHTNSRSSASQTFVFNYQHYFDRYITLIEPLISYIERQDEMTTNPFVYLIFSLLFLLYVPILGKHSTHRSFFYFHSML